MADEIVRLRQRVIGKDSISGADLLAFEMLFLYRVDPVIVVKGTPWAVTPRIELPPGVASYLLVTPDEMDELDAGTLAFWHERSIEQKDRESLGALLVRAQRLYVKRSGFIEEIRFALVNIGKRYDA